MRNSPFEGRLKVVAGAALAALVVLLGGYAVAFAARSPQLSPRLDRGAAVTFAQGPAMGAAPIHSLLFSSSFEVDATLGLVSCYESAYPEPSALRLSAAPNPFSTSAAIAFDTPQRAHVSVRVFDVFGRMVATLADGEYPPGHNSIQWKPSTPNGVYLIQVSADGQSQVQRILLLR